MSKKKVTDKRRGKSKSTSHYLLDAQVGFVLRQVLQRHATIFVGRMGEDLTMTQWAALSKLLELGPCSQNLLGRHTAMDAATIKGVVERLVKRGLLETSPDPEDGRRLLVALTPEGAALAERSIPVAHEITKATLSPLAKEERTLFLSLLERLK
ncbi:transcriptional regulator, MarR family [Rhodopseudomonas palustris HaA2]|uniref:Transcriptional regulator, MarR family n=1 Tax=Rhodopseudomonas palustris (strain HaA2) TaxID=316058 RepID=Q2IZJ3_RHOP2|nr:transcriptional regulator, MarR family [Rhodopseudomonas palustris HaA2]